MGYIAAVLGCFLFYRYVTWPHKVIAFKTAGGLASLGALLFLLTIYVPDRINEWHESKITVEPAGTSEAKANADGFLEAESGGDPFRYVKGEHGYITRFKLCNGTSRRVAGLRFRASGLIEGRSTTYKLMGEAARLRAGVYAPTMESGSSYLETDKVIQPKTCEVLGWQTNHRFDRYQTSVSYVTWEQ